MTGILFHILQEDTHELSIYDVFVACAEKLFQVLDPGDLAWIDFWISVVSLSSRVYDVSMAIAIFPLKPCPLNWHSGLALCLFASIFRHCLACFEFIFGNSRYNIKQVFDKQITIFGRTCLSRDGDERVFRCAHFRAKPWNGITPIL